MGQVMAATFVLYRELENSFELQGADEVTPTNP